MVKGFRLDTRLHTGLRSWGGSVRLGLRRAASPQLWRASFHSRRPSSAVEGTGGRAILHVTAKNEPAVQQKQQEHDGWQRTCEQVAAFQQQYSRLPRPSPDARGPLLPGERPLGLWCTAQLRRKAGSKGPPLTAEETNALQAIPGLGWWATKRVLKPWEQWRQEVEAFYQQHGRLPRKSAGQSSPFFPGEQALGTWINRQRNQFKGNVQPPLSAGHIAALEATLGWSWGGKTWEQRRQEVEFFHLQHGRLPRISAGQSCPFLPGEEELGRWVKTQRSHFRGHMQPPLSAERVAALERTPGWSWGEKPWEQRREEMEAFYQQHGRLPRTSAGQSCPFLPGEEELGAWITTQHSCFRGHQQPPLSAERIAALECIPGWRWGYTLEPWGVRCQQVQDFVRQHGRIPRQHGSKGMPLQPSEKELGVWCSAQRGRLRGTTKGQPPLTAEQQAALAALPGWFWDKDERWEQQRRQLEAFVQQHGRMPRKRALLKQPLLDGEQELGVWRARQRQRQRGTSGLPPLTAKQLAALNAIPFW